MGLCRMIVVSQQEFQLIYLSTRMQLERFSHNMLLRKYDKNRLWTLQSPIDDFMLYGKSLASKLLDAKSATGINCHTLQRSLAYDCYNLDSLLWHWPDLDLCWYPLHILIQFLLTIMSVLYKYHSRLGMKFPLARNKIVDPVYTWMSTVI